jgi:hypothetical protein
MLVVVDLIWARRKENKNLFAEGTGQVESNCSDRRIFPQPSFLDEAEPVIGRRRTRACFECFELAMRSPQFGQSSDQPSPFVDIELHQAFVAHFQQQGMACFLIRDIGALHDFVDFERLLPERAQDIFSIIQQDWTPSTTTRAHHCEYES